MARSVLHVLRPVTCAAALATLLVIAPSGSADDHPQPLAIGSPAPDFSLPGVDGRTYTLASFKSAKVLVVIFTAVHCPTAEIYEQRVRQIVETTRRRAWRSS